MDDLGIRRAKGGVAQIFRHCPKLIRLPVHPKMRAADGVHQRFCALDTVGHRPAVALHADGHIGDSSHLFNLPAIRKQAPELVRRVRRIALGATPQAENLCPERRRSVQIGRKITRRIPPDAKIGAVGRHTDAVRGAQCGNRCAARRVVRRRMHIAAPLDAGKSAGVRGVDNLRRRLIPKADRYQPASSHKHPPRCGMAPPCNARRRLCNLYLTSFSASGWRFATTSKASSAMSAASAMSASLRAALMK